MGEASEPGRYVYFLVAVLVTGGGVGGAAWYLSGGSPVDRGVATPPAQARGPAGQKEAPAPGAGAHVMAPAARDRPTWTPKAGELEPPVGVAAATGPLAVEKLSGGLEVVAGEAIVRFRDGTGEREMAEFHRQQGTRVLFRTAKGVRRVKLPDGVSTREGLARLGRDPRMLSVSANVGVPKAAR